MLFFDEMSKERKIQKDKEQSEKEWEKTKKKLKSAFLDAIEKYKKIQYTTTRCIFSYLFCIVCSVAKKYKIQNKYKKTAKTYESKNYKNTKYKKKQTQNLENIK